MTNIVDHHELPTTTLGELPMARDRGAGWSALRELGPVVAVDNFFYLTRREDILTALRSPEIYSSATEYAKMISPVPLLPLQFDPPEHTRYRKILQNYFSPQALKTLLPSLHAQVATLISAIADRRQCEVIADLATPYPSQVFLTLFGLPLDDRTRLIDWKDAVINLGVISTPEENDLAPAVELFTYLTDAVHEQRRTPRDGILSQLLHGDEPLTDDEAIGLSLVFVLAGLDTVTSSIGTTMLKLARRPDLRASLRQDPDRVPAFVEEMIRLEPAAPIIGRTTTRPVTIAGVDLPAGIQVNLCLGAINRDGSDAFSGDDISLDGKVHKHWGFGGGPHRCLGSHLARLELKLVVTEWLTQIPDFEVAPGFVPDIIWPAVTIGLKELPLRILPEKAS